MNSTLRKLDAFASIVAPALLLTSTHTVQAESAGTAGSEINERPEALVVLVATDWKNATTARLAASLEAHLNALPVKLEVMEGDLPADPRSAFPEASMILWLAEESETLVVLMPELEDEPRPVVADGELPGTQAWFEALAAIVYSDILAVIPEPLRVQPHEEKPHEEPQEEKPPQEASPKEAPPIEASPTQAAPKKETPAEPPSTKVVSKVVTSSPKSPIRGAPVWLGVQAAYAPSWPVKDRTVQHGTRLGAALWFLRYMATDITAEILPSFRIDAQGDAVSLARWPLRLFIRGLLPLRRFWLSTGVGLLVELSRIDELDGKLQQGSADQVQAVLGTSLAGGAGYWITTWLGVTVEGGVDLASRTMRYTVQGETVAHVGVARPSVLVGLALGLSVNRGRRHAR